MATLRPAQQLTIAPQPHQPDTLFPSNTAAHGGARLMMMLSAPSGVTRMAGAKA